MFYGYAILRHGLFILSPMTAAEGIVSTMSDALLLVSPDYRIQAVNQAAAEVLGYEKSELLNNTVDQLFRHKDGKFGGAQPFEEVLLNTGRLGDVEMFFCFQAREAYADCGKNTGTD